MVLFVCIVYIFVCACWLDGAQIIGTTYAMGFVCCICMGVYGIVGVCLCMTEVTNLLFSSSVHHVHSFASLV